MLIILKPSSHLTLTLLFGKYHNNSCCLRPLGFSQTQKKPIPAVIGCVLKYFLSWLLTTRSRWHGRGSKTRVKVVSHQNIHSTFTVFTTTQTIAGKCMQKSRYLPCKLRATVAVCYLPKERFLVQQKINKNVWSVLIFSRQQPLVA